MRLLLEGAAIEPLLERIRQEHGPQARIVHAERVRSGGVAGFFSREHFAVTVEVDPEAERAVEPAPAPVPVPVQALTSTRAKSAVRHGIDALVAAAEQEEAREAAVTTAHSSDPVPALVPAQRAPRDQDGGLRAELAPTSTVEPGVEPDVEMDEAPVPWTFPRAEDVPAHRPVSTEGPAFAAVLESLQRGASDVPAPTSPSPLDEHAPIPFPSDMTEQVITPDEPVHVAQLAHPQDMAELALAPDDRPALYEGKRWRDRTSAGRRALPVPPRAPATPVAGSPMPPQATTPPTTPAAAPTEVPTAAPAPTAAPTASTPEPSPMTRRELRARRAAAGHDQGPAAPAAPAAPSIPSIPSITSTPSTPAQRPAHPFAGLGLPEHLVSRLGAHAGAAELVDLLAELPVAEAVPPRAGHLVAVVGEREAALTEARAIAEELRLGRDAVVVAGRGGLVTTDQARTCAATVRLGEVPAVVVVESDLGSDQTWTRQMLRALTPDQVVAVVDATRRPGDTAAWLQSLAVRGFDVGSVRAHRVAATGEPGAVLGLGVAVASVDGRTASPREWAAVLLDRVQRRALEGGA